MNCSRTNVPLAELTSLRIGGNAREFHAPETEEDLRRILGETKARGESPFILGGGTNTLFPDGEFSRPVISTGHLHGLEADGNTLRAECGVSLRALIHEAISRGLCGLEGLVGIPGTVGGAAFMNAGGNGWNLGDAVEELGVLPLDGGSVIRLKGREVRWDYRTAHLEGVVIVWLKLSLRHDDPAAIRQRAEEAMRRKAEAQPLREPSAGCVFKNPPGLLAGQLIDQLGLKGLRCGGAKVSERHANFIVNASRRARAQDVLDLLTEVRARVSGAFGVTLETEIVFA